MEEIWKDIKGYEGNYQCSNLGRVRSLDRYVKEHTGKEQFRHGQIIAFRMNPSNGYYQFGLNKDGKRKIVYAHIIIASTFIDNPDSQNLKYVNHKDGNKLNNKIENLEWCTASENNIHSYRELNRKKSDEGAHPKIVYIIDTKNKILKYYESIAETSRNINLSCTQVNRYIHSNKKWKGRYIFVSDNDKGVEDIKRVS